MAKRYKKKTARSGLETVVNLLALLLFAVLGIGFVAALFFTQYHAGLVCDNDSAVCAVLQHSSAVLC